MHIWNCSRRSEKVYVYAHMKNDQDTRVAKYQEYQSKGMSLYSLLVKPLPSMSLNSWPLRMSSTKLL